MIGDTPNRINNPCVRFWLLRKGYSISAPYGEWNYWHVIKNDGGIAPLNEKKLMAEYLSDPLSQDAEAQKYREAMRLRG